MPISPEGFIIDEQGTRTGGQIDVETGQFITPPPESGAIISSSLKQEPSLDLPLQQQEDPKSLQATIGAIPALSDIFGPTQPNATEKTQDDLSARILQLSQQLTGKQTAQLKAEETVGVPGLRTQLQDAMNQLQALQKEAVAIPLQIQEEFTGRGVTKGGIAPVEAGRLRQNAIKALSISAAAQTFQGNLSLAQQQVDRAIDIEFGNIESQIKFLGLALDINRERLSREDQKRADARKIILQERQRILDERKEERKAIYDVMLSASQNGADMSTIDKIKNSQTREQALYIGSFSLGQEFRRKVEKEQFEKELQSATFNLSFDKFMEDARQFDLRSEQDKLQFGRSLVEQQRQFDVRIALDKQKIAYEKWEKLQKQNPVAAAEQSSIILQDKVSLIDSLLIHKGISKAVGPSIFGRITPFKVDVWSGEVQDFIAGVTQLVNKETIDTLVNLKARGGTLGALSDQERLLLQSSATKIGTWQIMKKGQITGYNIDEDSFKKELNKIKELSITAQARALGGGIGDNTKVNEIEELKQAGYSEEQIRLLMELQ